MASKPFAAGHILTAADVNDLTGVYDRSTGAVDVTNTTTETDLFSKAITAAHLSSDRMLRLTLLGDVLNNTGGAVNMTLRVKLGGTTWYGDLIGVAANATRQALRMVVELANRGATNVQFGTVFVATGATAAGSVAGIGTLNGPMDGTGNWGTDAGARLGMTNGDIAIDTTADQALAVSVQWASASANLSFRKRYAILELL